MQRRLFSFETPFLSILLQSLIPPHTPFFSRPTNLQTLFSYGYKQWLRIYLFSKTVFKNVRIKAYRTTEAKLPNKPMRGRLRSTWPIAREKSRTPKSDWPLKQHIWRDWLVHATRGLHWTNQNSHCKNKYIFHKVQKVVVFFLLFLNFSVSLSVLPTDY